MADEKGLLCSRLPAKMEAGVIRVDTRDKDLPHNFLNDCKRSTSLGEHVLDVYQKELGLSENEIEALVRDGVIQVMKSNIKDWLKVLVLLLDEAAAVVLVLVILWALKIEIPLPIAVFVALLLGGLVFVIHKAVVPTFHKKQVTGAEGLVGLEGEVIEPLTPVGVIKIKDEYWKAKSVGENIAVGEEVEILEIKGLTLMVKRKSQRRHHVV